MYEPGTESPGGMIADSFKLSQASQGHELLDAQATADGVLLLGLNVAEVFIR